MENFMLKEYFNNKLAIQREYFLDVKELPSLNNISLVIINGKKYEKSDMSDGNIENILYIPKESLKSLPIIQLFYGKDFITFETSKIVKGKFLEIELYSLAINESAKEIKASLKVQRFDISDEIGNKEYLIDYFVEKAIKKETSKKMIGEMEIAAVRDSNQTFYTVSLDGTNLFSQVEQNNVCLYDLVKSLSKQIEEKNNLLK